MRRTFIVSVLLFLFVAIISSAQAEATLSCPISVTVQVGSSKALKITTDAEEVSVESANTKIASISRASDGARGA